MPVTSLRLTEAAHVFWVFLRLGLTSFGGPVAHLGYFHDTFVLRRRWLSATAYADLVALCQFLPGPASSQVGMGIGLQRAGHAGALAAWLGFTLPSAVLMIVAAVGLARYGALLPAGLLQGLKLAAVAVVAQAVWGMASSLCRTRLQWLLMAGTASVVLLLPGAITQLLALTAAGVIGWHELQAPLPPVEAEAPGHAFSRRGGAGWLLGLGLLLMGLPLWAHGSGNPAVAVFDAFFRTGSLVFGGGHVVLPLLEAEVVRPGWVGSTPFLAGYSLAQAVPGPLFTFAAFLGAAMPEPLGGWQGGILCLVAIFLPSFMLVAGVWPFWARLRGRKDVRAVLGGVNAAVVGLLVAALYQPVWTGAVHQAADFVVVLLAGVLLMVLRWPAWSVVGLAGLTGWLAGLF